MQDNVVVCACFTDVHTEETSRIRMNASTRKRKMFLALIALGFSSTCAYIYTCSYFTTVNQVLVYADAVNDGDNSFN